MVPGFLLTLGLLASASTVSAIRYTTQSPLGITCWSAGERFNYGCKKDKCYCKSTPFLGTALTCIRQSIPEGSGHDVDWAYRYIQKTCEDVKVKWTFNELDDIYYNASSYLADPPKNKSDLIDMPVNVVGKKFMDALILSGYSLYDQYKKGVLYGCMLMTYFLSICVLATAHNFIIRYYSDVLFKAERAIGFGKIRKYFTLSAVGKENHSRPYKLFCAFFSFGAPTRGQSLIIFGYLILNIIFLCVSYGSPVDGVAPDYQGISLLKLHGFRAGALAYTQLPLIVLFACRNNWLIWLTNWPYSTFQVYHRWVARTMVCHSIIHVGIYFYNQSRKGPAVWASKMATSVFWQYGFLAVLCCTLMALTSFHFFRRRFYEYFYMAHKIMYLGFLIGLGSHVWRREWMLFIWISVGIHATERITRLLKVLFAGFKNSAVAKYQDDGVITVSVNYSTRWDVRPGQYCYIRILHKNLFWQAHPFSVYQSPDPTDNTLHFALRARSGATYKLKKFLEEQKDSTATIPVFVEGPYGNEAPVKKHSSLLLMAGGIGVTATYQYALEARGRGQRVVFMWIIPDLLALEYFSDELLALLADPNFEVQIYVTRNFVLSGGETEEDDESMLYSAGDSEKKSGDFNESTREHIKTKSVSSAQLIKNQHANIFMGRRPDVGEEVTKLMANRDTMAIVSCGPPTFVDNIRASIVSNIADAKERVDYFEESFSW